MGSLLINGEMFNEIPEGGNGAYISGDAKMGLFVRSRECFVGPDECRFYVETAQGQAFTFPLLLVSHFSSMQRRRNCLAR